MALVLADRVKETCTSPGTGNATLLGASVGFQSFSVIGNGNTTYYTISDQFGARWEVGIGTYTSSGTTLSRDVVLSSSNGGLLVDFNSGTQDVYVVYPAEKAIYANASGVISAGTWNATPIGVAYGGTGQTTYTNGQLLIGNSTGNTLTKATLTQGTGIAITNGSGAITIANSAPDQTVVLTNGTGISISGAYPSFTITNSAPDQTVVLNSGSGINVTGTYPNFTIAATGGGMVYPSAGIAVSTGSAWGTSLTAPSGAVVGTSDTQTLTNKRINPRVLASTADVAEPTLNTDDYDIMVITGQTNAITSFTTNLTGTPVNGQKLWISITGTTAIAITWGASFESSTVTLPTTTVSTNRLDVGFIWNVATSKWRCVGAA